jgi:hypothetical protein
MRQSRTLPQLASPGRRASLADRPPHSCEPSAIVTSAPRWPSARAASSPEGPPPTTSTCSRAPSGGIASGCQPRRHSSPMVGFWVQRIGAEKLSVAAHRLQPMHSRMSSMRPSSIFLGRNGSAIEARADPIMSMMPWRITRTMESGEV